MSPRRGSTAVGDSLPTGPGWPRDRVLVADDEYVVVRAVRESTWSAESFRGFATPQGVTTAVEMVHIWRLVDSKIVEHWAVRDDLALMMQLGVVESGKAARPRVRRSKPGSPLEARSHLLATPLANRLAGPVIEQRRLGLSTLRSVERESQSVRGAPRLLDGSPRSRVSINASA